MGATYLWRPSLRICLRQRCARVAGERRATSATSYLHHWCLHADDKVLDVRCGESPYVQGVGGWVCQDGQRPRPLLGHSRRQIYEATIILVTSMYFFVTYTFNWQLMYFIDFQLINQLGLVREYLELTSKKGKLI